MENDGFRYIEVVVFAMKMWLYAMEMLIYAMRMQ